MPGILYAALAVLDPNFDLSGVRSNRRLAAAAAVSLWVNSRTSAD
jgi:hypothetical protein